MFYFPIGWSTIWEWYYFQVPQANQKFLGILKSAPPNPLQVFAQEPVTLKEAHLAMQQAKAGPGIAWKWWVVLLANRFYQKIEVSFKKNWTIDKYNLVDCGRLKHVFFFPSSNPSSGFRAGLWQSSLNLHDRFEWQCRFGHWGVDALDTQMASLGPNLWTPLLHEWTHILCLTLKKKTQSQPDASHNFPSQISWWAQWGKMLFHPSHEKKLDVLGSEVSKLPLLNKDSELVALICALTELSISSWQLWFQQLLLCWYHLSGMIYQQKFQSVVKGGAIFQSQPVSKRSRPWRYEGGGETSQRLARCQSVWTPGLMTDGSLCQREKVSGPIQMFLYL